MVDKFGTHFGTELPDANTHQWWDSARASDRLAHLAAVASRVGTFDPADNILSLLAARTWRGLPKEWKLHLRKYHLKQSKRETEEPQTNILDISDIMDKYHNFLINVAWKVTGNGDAAEDVVQNVYLYLVDKNIQVRNEPSTSSFLKMLAKQRAIDWVRRDTHQRGYPQDVAFDPEGTASITNRAAHDFGRMARDRKVSPPSAASHRELSADIQRVLASFGDRQFARAMKLHLQGKSRDAIAQELGIDGNSVNAHLHFARRKMAPFLKKWKPQTEGEGEGMTLADVFGKYHNTLVHHAWKTTNDQGDAEDAVQNVYAQLASQNIQVVDGPTALAYLRKLTQQRAIDLTRARRKHRGFPKAPEGPTFEDPNLKYAAARDQTSMAHDQVRAPEIAAHWSDMRDKLLSVSSGNTQKLVISLYLSGKGKDAIAQELGISPSAVRAHLFNVKQKLVAAYPRLTKSDVTRESIDAFGGDPAGQSHYEAEQWWENLSDDERLRILRLCGYDDPTCVVNSGVKHVGFLPEHIRREIYEWHRELTEPSPEDDPWDAPSSTEPGTYTDDDGAEHWL